LTLIPDSRDLGTERERERKEKKGRKEIVRMVTNNELDSDWIIRSPYDCHLTISFYCLIDVINNYQEKNNHSDLNQ
jgi:hypothetical protein